MKQDEILKIVEEYVKQKCINDSSGHDWWHIKRVEKNAMLINKDEKANEFVIKMIVYMHDLYDHKFYSGDSSIELKKTLRKLKIYESILEDDINNIIYSCVNLGFSSNFDNKKELSKEGQIAQDADRLDAMGAIRIARTFAYGGKKGNLIYDPNINNNITQKEYETNSSNTSIDHFYDKLLKIKDLMNTVTAKNIANKRHEYIENFLDEFLNEWNGIK